MHKCKLVDAELVTLRNKVTDLCTTNDKLRGILATSSLDCIYCGLPEVDTVKCIHGFPGCGRADDLMVYESNKAHDKLQRKTKG